MSAYVTALSAAVPAAPANAPESRPFPMPFASLPVGVVQCPFPRTGEICRSTRMPYPSGGKAGIVTTTDVQLSRSDLGCPGIRRIRCGRGFRYVDPEGKPIRD